MLTTYYQMPRGSISSQLLLNFTSILAMHDEVNEWKIPFWSFIMEWKFYSVPSWNENSILFFHGMKIPFSSFMEGTFHSLPSWKKHSILISSFMEGTWKEHSNLFLYGRKSTFIPSWNEKYIQSFMEGRCCWFMEQKLNSVPSWKEKYIHSFMEGKCCSFLRGRKMLFLPSW